MAIKEIPTTTREYFKSMRDTFSIKKETALAALVELENDIKVLYDDIKLNIDVYKNSFKVDLMTYEEFVNNEYSTGKFFKVARGMFINRSNNYELVSDLFDVYKLANKQKEIYNIKKDIDLYNRVLSLTLKEYTALLRTYFMEVHKRMVKDGCGYVISNTVGWICVNRCKVVNPRPHIDYQKTKEREAELKAAGKRIFNKAEYEWCVQHGIEYKAEDKRVFRESEYCYEIPLIGCKLPSGDWYGFEVANRVARDIRNNKYAELAALGNNTVEGVCALDIDLKKKVTICDMIDKTIYTNFIRNESQQPLATPKAYRKDRQ